MGAATEGETSHKRSGPVLHATIAVWRDAARLAGGAPKEQGRRHDRTARPNLSGTKDRGSGKRMARAMRATLYCLEHFA